MAKAKAPKAVEQTSKTSRTGYKRKTNKRINPLLDQLVSRARKVLKHDESFGNPRTKPV